MVDFVDCIEDDDDIEFIIHVAQHGKIWSATVDGYAVEGMGFSAFASIENLLGRINRIRDLNSDVDPAEFTDEDVDLAEMMMFDPCGRNGERDNG